MGVQINGSEGNVIATKGTYSGNVTIGGTLTYEDVTNIDSVGLVTARTGIEIGARPGVAASISVDGNMVVSGITTIGNSSGGNEKLNVHGAIRSSGSSANFNAGLEGTLVDYDIANNVSRFGHVNGASGSARDVVFLSGGAEKLRLKSSGAVGMGGTTSPAGMLEVQKNGVPSIISNYNSSKHLEMSVGGSGGGFKVTDGNHFAVSHQPFTDRGTDNNLTERFRIQANGLVGVNETPTIAQFQVKSAQLGGTAGNTQEVLRLHSPDVTNTTSYRFTNYRVSNGTSHSSSELRFRRHVDATDMGYFGLGDGYASIGYASNERFRVSSAGLVTKPQTPSFFVTINGGDATTNIGNKIPWNVVKHNTGNHYDTSNYYFVAPVSGHYFFHTQLWAKNGTSNARFHFYVADASNSYAGSQITQNGMHANSLNRGDVSLTASIVWYLDVDDRISVRVDNANLTYYTAGASSPHSYFCGYLIG
jgi:hypothetical protein